MGRTRLEKRFVHVRFYNPALTEVQKDVEIGVGSFWDFSTRIHERAHRSHNPKIPLLKMGFCLYPVYLKYIKLTS